MGPQVVKRRWKNRGTIISIQDYNEQKIHASLQGDGGENNTDKSQLETGKKHKTKVKEKINDSDIYQKTIDSSLA